MTTATVFFVRVEVLNDDNETRRRWVTWAKRNIKQVSESLGDARLSIAVYDDKGHQESFVGVGNPPVPPETLEELP